jgi:hypothetical protein
MDPAALIPTPDAIPVAWGWFELFLLLAFFAHILLMNVMLGSAFIALISHFRGDSSTICTETVSQTLPFTIAFAVNFGVAPLLFVQVLYGHLMYTSSILTAVFWLSIVGLLIVAYALAYVYKDRYAQLARVRLPVVGLITLLLLVIAFFFSNNLTLMQTPTSWSRSIGQVDGLLLNLDDPMFFPRYLHFMVSAVAIGGLAIALFFQRKQRRGEHAAGVWVVAGCRWFSYATMLNFAVGLWFLAALPQGVLTASNTTGLLLLTSLGCGIALALPAVFFGLTTRALPALFCILGSLALMILARSLLRTTLLAPWFSVSQLPLSLSSSPLLFFLFFIAAGLALIVWMVRFTLRSWADNEGRS